MAAGILEGIRAVELGSFICAPYCGKVLADLGAEVIKLEEPGSGDRARWWGPFPSDRPDPEASGLFLYLNGNKKSVTLDVATESGRSILRSLARQADVFIEDRPPGALDEMGLGYAALAQTNRRLVMASITPFGQKGPYRDFKAYHLNIYHAGGEAYVFPGAKELMDRPPVKGPGLIGDYDAGLTAALAALAALFSRESTQEGQHIDISRQACCMAHCRVNIVGRYTAEGFIEDRATLGRRVGSSIRCKDGYVEFRPMVDTMMYALLEMMGDAARPIWDIMEDAASKVTRADEINALIERWARDRTKQELMEQGQELGIPTGIVATPRDLVEAEQLRLRGFFTPVPHRGRSLKMPFPFYGLSEGRPVYRTAAPLLGQHTEEVLGQALGYGKEDLLLLKQAGVV